VELGCVIAEGQNNDMPADECICSARCDSIIKGGETGHDVCSGLGVGNNKAKNSNIFGVEIVSLGLATKDECICSASCDNNCTKIMFRKELELGIKYCPNLEIDLPVYHHIEYKPRYSAKQHNIFKLDTDTIQTQCIMHIEPDHTGKEDVHQPGGGDGHGRGARVGLDDGDHGERDVRHGGLVEGGAERWEPRMIARQ
jgi:hypothetical protein